jgi:hypothetical protein
MLVVGLELTKDFSATAFYAHDSRFNFAFEAGVSNLASLSLGGWKHSRVVLPPAPQAGASRACASGSGSETDSSGVSASHSDSTESSESEARVHVDYNSGPMVPAPSPSSRGGPIIEENARLAPLLAPPDHRQSIFIRRLYFRQRPSWLSHLVPQQLVAGAGPHDLGSGDRSAPEAPPVPSHSEDASDSSGSPEPSDSESSDPEFELVSDLPGQVLHKPRRHCECRSFVRY